MTPDGNVATQAEEVRLGATKLEVLLSRFSRVRVTVCLGSLVGWRRKRRELGREVSAWCLPTARNTAESAASFHRRSTWEADTIVRAYLVLCRCP